MQKPRKKRQAYQQWQVENRAQLDAEMKLRWKRNIDDIDDPAKDGDDMVAFRQLVARELFSELDEAAKLACAQRAAAHAEEQRRAFEEARKQTPMRSPEALQSYVLILRNGSILLTHVNSTIDNLAAFLTPIMENVQKHTGLMMVVYAFGPMPSENGELGCIT